MGSWFVLLALRPRSSSLHPSFFGKNATGPSFDPRVSLARSAHLGGINVEMKSVLVTVHWQAGSCRVLNSRLTQTKNRNGLWKRRDRNMG